MLIAVGESVVALGMGLAGRDLRAGFILTSVHGLSVAAALWWLYFDGEDGRAERALLGADRARSPWLALYAFGYAFLVILGGIIIFAAGVKLAIIRSAQLVLAPAAWFLGGGVATYVVGLVWFRRLLGTGAIGVRLRVAFLALSSGIVGLAVSPEAQLAALVAILGGGVVAESRLARRQTRPGRYKGGPIVPTSQQAGKQV